jgi:hypothetical protein
MIFIVGVGRSGTSLLQSMLNAHPEIVSTPETHFLKNYVFPNMKNNLLLDSNIFLRKIQIDKSLNRIPIPINDILYSKSKVDLLAFYKKMFKVYSEKKNKTFLVDKDPGNINYIKELNEIFPHSKIIHVYRDPRDIVLSKTKAAWSKRRPYWLHALIGQYQLKIGRRNGIKYFSKNNQYIEIQYENLLESPEDTLRLISNFIGIEFDLSMLSFSNSAKELVNENELQWKKETLKPLMKNNTNKWKLSLTNFQAALIEQFSSEYFNQLEYSKEAIKKISLIDKIAIYFLSILNLFVTIFYKLKR